MTFAHEMLATVTIKTSQESGVVVGRAEYVNSGNAYFVRYQRLDGVATEAWWPEDALAGRAERVAARQADQAEAGAPRELDPGADRVG